ncbi:class I SAM-dependent methyltransferase [Fulvivirgaceae bacterium BMA12]|uniref:Class I SAM-dependent methyltransferase n=1 Tax=Agaribacillus aureus TaxID=3051825 RepID=A0ABT8LE35_9BACT|nr:class I SAM-dependent methyltransferase [Fulvivirgaceae bacterium BMA12]
MNYTTEITSDKIPSDNPIHQRLLKAYIVAIDLIEGDLLEIGCGEGRGISLLSSNCRRYVALDKITATVEHLSCIYKNVEFINATIPPISDVDDNTFDTIVSFQVIEHIKNDRLFLKEIHRVLKPGGKAFITTPNIKKTLSRNPWHIREYTAESLEKLASDIFRKVTMKGIAGDEKVMKYHDMNKKSVEKITRFDIFNLQYLLPAALLKIPYEILNRFNRNKLKSADNKLVMDISHDNYLLREKDEENLDLFCIMEK